MSAASVGWATCQCGTARLSSASEPPAANSTAPARAIVTRGTSILVPRGFTPSDCTDLPGCTFGARRAVQRGTHAGFDAGLPAHVAAHLPSRRAALPGQGDRHRDGRRPGADDVRPVGGADAAARRCARPIGYLR